MNQIDMFLSGRSEAALLASYGAEVIEVRR